MTTRGDYVVEVTAVPDEPFEVVRARVEHLLKLSPEKAEALLARVPGVVTKGLPAERALRVVLRMQAAGLSALHRKLRPDELPAAAAAPPSEAPAPAADTAPPQAPAPAAPPAPAEAPASGRDTEVELEHDPAAYVPPAPPRDPTGYDQIPSLDATHGGASAAATEPDPKLTPMTEAGFGAADVVLPTGGEAPRRPPTLVDSGPVSRPLEAPPVRDAGAGPRSADTERAAGDSAGPRDAGAAARAALRGPRAEDDAPASPAPDAHEHHSDDADPTMILPPSAEPPPAPTPARKGPAPVAPSAASGGARHPTLTDADLRLTPPPGVSYRSTGSGARRAVTLTPPPDDVLRQSGVHEDELATSAQRRRGRFGRRLSGLVMLPVMLSWVLSAVFLYVLLPEGVRDELWVPLAAATAVAALTGALAAGLATGGIVDDVVRLRDATRRLAMGDLETPVPPRRKDELGDIAASIDRLRVSLQEALGRLRKRG